MNNTEIHIGKNTPVNKELLWIRPLNPGVSLYGNVNGKWEPLKLIDGKGTRTVEDDEVIDVASDIYSKEEIDERFADILGLDAEGIAELKALIEDGDALTGLLSEINNKADKTELENVAYTNVANRFTDANYFRHGDSDTAVLINNGGISVHLASNLNQQWCHVEKDSIAFRDTAIGNIAFKPILNNNVVRLAGGVNHANYKPLAYLEDVSSNLLNYETKMTFTTASGAIVGIQPNTYYRYTDVVRGLSIALPNSTAGTMCAFNFTTYDEFFNGITITGGTIKKMKDFAIEKGKTYELVALYDGAKWLVTATEFE